MKKKQNKKTHRLLVIGLYPTFKEWKNRAPLILEDALLSLYPTFKEWKRDSRKTSTSLLQ